MSRWLCCYDVVDDRRRNRLFRKLKGFLRPVQQSVFEGFLSPARRRELERMVLHVIDPKTDTVRLYPLCGRCADGTILIGTAAPIDDPDAPLFF